MMFWVFASISWIFSEKNFVSKTTIVIAFCIVGVSLLLDELTAKILPVILTNAPNELPRTKVVSDIFSKILWFVLEPLVDSLNFSSIHRDQPIAIIMAGFIGFGLWSYWRIHAPRLRIQKAILALWLIPLCYLPNLLVQENWASYRTQIALTSLLVLYGIIAVIGWLQWLHQDHHISGLMTIIVVLTAWFAHRNVVSEFIKPQVEEIAYITSYLDHKSCLKTSQLIYLIPSKWQDSRASFVRYDEFGRPSSSAPWAIQGIVWIILRQENNPAAAKMVNAKIGLPNDVSNGICVLDFHHVLSDHPAT
jgi:hypothetical protein